MRHKKFLHINLALALGLMWLPGKIWADPVPDLDQYLSSHPAFAEAMIWEYPAVPKGQAKIITPDSGSASREQTTTTTGFWKLLRFNSASNSHSISIPSKVRLNLGRPHTIISPPDENLDPQSNPLIDLGLYRDVKVSYIPINIPQEPNSNPPPQEYPEADPIKAASLNWNLFTPEHKQKIKDDFASMWTWVEACWPKYQTFRDTNEKPEGFDGCFDTTEPANYPPVNLQWQESPLPGYSSWTVISSDAAFDLYSKMVALSLVLEIKGVLQWTLAELSPDSLKEIFDGSKWFRYMAPGSSDFGIISNEGYLVLTTNIPAPATLTFSFLAQNKMILGSKMASLVKVMEWERDNLRHTAGGKLKDDCPWKNGGLYALYKGRPPLSRAINGTIQGCPYYVSNGQGGEIEVWEKTLQHWIGGCGGAAGFNEQVFRVMNIPAQMTRYSHAQNNFIIDNNVRVWMAHADDSYGQKYSIFKPGATPEIPMAEIFVDDATFKSWVVDYDYNDPNLTQAQKTAYEAQNLKATCKPSIDLMIKYLPKNMLVWQCIYDQNKAHDQTYLYNSYFKLVYSLPELEAMTQGHWATWGYSQAGVWQSIDTKLNSLVVQDDPNTSDNEAVQLCEYWKW